MATGAEPIGQAPARRTSLAVDNLRAIVILLVLAFHSVLAYLDFLPHRPFAFDDPPFLWRAFPIVDDQRWLGFDLFCAWLDVFLMSFFLLLSGLFAWPSLSRKGARAFLADRVLRLGLPFAAVVILLMPLAQYPTYLQSAADPGIADYWRHWRHLPLWPSGPVWFLWILLVGDMLAAGLYQLLAVARRHDCVPRLSSSARQHPARFLGALVLASAVAYVPLALVFGPSDWAQRGPFSFQLSRPLHYAVYFLAGVAIGACGIERGLLAPDGPLARRWRRWLSAAVLLFGLWAGTTALTLPGPAPFGFQVVSDLSFVLACFVSCFAVLAAAVRFAGIRRPVLDSLKANAYGMYLIHYVFVVWLQYALLPVGLPAVVKGAIVFGGTLLLSWTATAASRRVPAIAQIIGADRAAPAGAMRPAPAPSRSPGLAR
jgi:glucans biosynthesis protein C